MMRVTIIPSDRIVTVDGRTFGDIDMSTVDTKIHAVQWYGAKGEVEYLPDANGKKPQNATINTIAAFQALVDACEARRVIADAPPPPPTPEQIAAAKVAAAESAIQAMLDSRARQNGYDGILSAASYAALPANTPFQSEGAAFLLWRAQCWAKCYEILGAVNAGTRTEPTLVELITEMPALVLP